MLISSNNNSNNHSKESSAQRKQRRRQRMVRKANATHSSSSSMSMRASKEIYTHTRTHTHAPLTHSQALLACKNTYETRSITLTITHTHTRTHADDASQQQRSDFMQNIPNCFMRFVRHFVVVLATSGQQQRQRQRRRRLLRAPALAVFVCMCVHIFVAGFSRTSSLTRSHTPTAAVALKLVCRDVIAYAFMRVYCVSFVFVSVFNNFWGRVSVWNLNCA